MKIEQIVSDVYDQSYRRGFNNAMDLCKKYGVEFVEEQLLKIKTEKVSNCCSKPVDNGVCRECKEPCEEEKIETEIIPLPIIQTHDTSEAEELERRAG